MNPWELATSAKELSGLISESATRAVVDALDGLEAGAQARRIVRTTVPAEAQPILASMILEAGVSESCAALAAAAATRIAIDAETEEIELVWTGPATVPVPNHRPTAAVVHELIASAQSDLTLATFSAGSVGDLLSALDGRRRDGVKIRLLLETPKSDGSGPDCPAVFSSLIPYVNALHWPRVSRPNHDWTSMHVKILIRDSDAVLVTSANMSGSAMRDNMELGVLIRGGDTATRLRAHFDDLETHGVIQRLV